MIRPLRIQYPSAWYHVTSRGRRGEQVFVSKDDDECFFAALKQAIELFTLRVSAYCLMTTYYHLLLQTQDTSLSRYVRV